MKYKTIMLELLQQRPEMYERLRQHRKLLPMLEMYAKELRDSHRAIMAQLQEAWPNSDPRRISSEAFEMALKEMEDRLRPASATDDQELSFDAAMAHIRNPSQRG